MRRAGVGAGRLSARLASRYWNKRKAFCGLHQIRSVVSVPEICQPVHSVSREEFRKLAFDTCKPLVMRGDTPPGTISKWFQFDAQGRACATPYLSQFGRTSLVQYELLRDSPESVGGLEAFRSWLEAKDRELAAYIEQSEESLLHIHAPLALFLNALEYNSSSPKPVTQIYIAQVPLSELPAMLQGDLPAPEVVKSAGRGDIYNSSIWLGLEPTYTSWHRDPNPNLFSQLHSSKKVRMLPPNAGQAIFRQVQARLGRSGNAHIRGYEMMYGEEREALQEAIWSSSAPGEIQETRLDAGDSLFIPKGWWHSIKSVAGDGRLNCSVNWWFR
ncbi:hypothetical protein DL546_000507 [Coniochaeta pulveracea]|uniref:JmjC domain-containing protein n=1 Tax=Coniochaeta pulveracea TaxID=177199 RepID=A0A420YAB3_9PEZI|nr:hypothetical protein DL546_000507 [Coniochaeta pulveracea]